MIQGPEKTASCKVHPLKKEKSFPVQGRIWEGLSNLDISAWKRRLPHPKKGSKASPAPVRNRIGWVVRFS